MKFLTLALLATTLLATTANAGITASVRNNETAEGLVSSTLAPVLSIRSGLQCLKDVPAGMDITDDGSCLGFSTLAPFATTTLLLVLKEEAQQVEADAYNFLAGEEISLALGEQMNKMRETFPELANSSDEEVIALMLEMAKI